MKIENKIKIAALMAVLSLGSVSEVQAQQDPQFTQYMYNPSNINPAYTGSRGNLSVFGQYRAQWVGLDGAPKTANISVETPIEGSRVGLGINFMNDRIGAIDENRIALNFSYTIDVNDDWKLAFGLKGTVNLLSFDPTKLDWYDPDVNYNQKVNNKFTPNIGAGMFLYSEKGYLGFSVPMMLSTDSGEDDGAKLMKQKMHYYLTGGYVFELSPSVKFKPAFLAKAVDGAPFQLDLTANFLLVDKFTVGAAYRVDAGVSGLAGFQVNDNLFIGYSYDADTSKLNKYNDGSHEVFLRFDLFNRYRKVSTTRFF
ncbi:type IX secretion system membrane protein PorP/SprF [Myroides albus]|uniref:Type IX secretion system membrane protein PorP/SprF n=1 Tax=Myroides albus TaxID=2562892 RepID=A0A6I3LTN5_9FLAO|nr:type IX secretion system membrane protein PorP/SprF [Myroides albus]MTG99312.1 type IX secretion system membrane protein PorP/SprF [Myroides albus]UVD80220.1 type IX secretion system membrane protein PorP/SprF [Myroides albus]